MVGGRSVRQDKGQPHSRHLAKAQLSFPVAVGRKPLIEQGRHVHGLQLRQQNGNVVYSFDFDQSDILVHERQEYQRWSIFSSRSPFERTISETFPDLELKWQVVGGQ